MVTLGFDDFFAQNRTRYYDMIQQTRDMEGDHAHWIEYIPEGLMSSVEIVEVRIKEGSLNLERITITSKQDELVALLREYGVLGAAKIWKEMNVNRARVNQLISPLVRSGIVVRSGAARDVRYKLNVK